LPACLLPASLMHRVHQKCWSAVVISIKFNFHVFFTTAAATALCWDFCNASMHGAQFWTCNLQLFLGHCHCLVATGKHCSFIAFFQNSFGMWNVKIQWENDWSIKMTNIAVFSKKTCLSSPLVWSLCPIWGNMHPFWNPHNTGKQSARVWAPNVIESHGNMEKCIESLCCLAKDKHCLSQCSWETDFLSPPKQPIAMVTNSVHDLVVPTAATMLLHELNCWKAMQFITTS